MAGKYESASFFWVEEVNGQVFVPMDMRTKRKYRPRKLEFSGWGSRSLIDFLESIGKDTSTPISQYDVSNIINEYINKNKLLDPSKKKKVICDDKLRYLFGKQKINRIKIHDMLEAHFASNNEESDGNFLFSSEDDENTLEIFGKQQKSSEKKNHPKKKVMTNPKSCFASIIPSNVKLLYLRRSLVEDLAKDSENFENKVVGSFIRIKCDPNDYLQKNSHQLVKVTGVKKGSVGGKHSEIILQVSNVIREISISKLSDDNFSEEECEDLRQRVKDGLLKKPTVVEFENKVRALHEDITKHWLEREIALLQNRIDRANEKGWRKEMFEYLERRQLLKNPDEKARLLREVPEVIAEDLEPQSIAPDITDKLKVEDNVRLKDDSSKLIDFIPYGKVQMQRDVSEIASDYLVAEATNKNIPDNQKQESISPRSTLPGQSEPHLCNVPAMLDLNSSIPMSEENWFSVSVQNQPEQPTEFLSREKMTFQTTVANRVCAPQVIELSDDEENEAPGSTKQCSTELLESLIWHYIDPQGETQGPFSITSLKRWSDAHYFPPDFKVWKTGQNSHEAVLLLDILPEFFPS